MIDNDNPTVNHAERTERSLTPHVESLRCFFSFFVGTSLTKSARVSPPRLSSRFGGAPYADVVLSAGEVLYIPPRWWHFVEARETSFSVSFWWR